MTTKFKPILFSTPMVESLLAGIKSETRRTKGLERVNLHPDEWVSATEGPWPANEKSEFFTDFFNSAGSGEWQACFSQYDIGDILWVRETFFDAREFKKAPLFVDGPGFYYRADGSSIGDHRWKPSIHMPKQAARIFLKVTDIIVERLQHISEYDAIAEGITPLAMSAMQLAERGQLYLDYCKPQELFMDGLSPVDSFKSLWCYINGEYHWVSNPWVWVYKFERVERPINFN